MCHFPQHVTLCGWTLQQAALLTILRSVQWDYCGILPTRTCAKLFIRLLKVSFRPKILKTFKFLNAGPYGGRIFQTVLPRQLWIFSNQTLSKCFLWQSLWIFFNQTLSKCFPWQSSPRLPIWILEFQIYILLEIELWQCGQWENAKLQIFWKWLIVEERYDFAVYGPCYIINRRRYRYRVLEINTCSFQQHGKNSGKIGSNKS